VAAVAELLGPQDLAGVRVLVTAGPTREALDAVRFLSNRSTGKMGFAVAAAAAARGATVTLVHGPVSLAAPPGVTAVPVSSAAEMAAAVTDRFAEQDAVIKVAAVADYRPAEVIAGKRKKGDDTWTLELERTEDILAGLAADKGDRVLVGFAAEAERVAEHAAEKLVRKGLDLIVANDITRADAGFGADTNAATIIGADGQREEVDLVDKRVLAHRVLDRVVGILGSRT